MSVWCSASVDIIYSFVHRLHRGKLTLALFYIVLGIKWRSIQILWREITSSPTVEEVVWRQRNMMSWIWWLIRQRCKVEKSHNPSACGYQLFVCYVATSFLQPSPSPREGAPEMWSCRRVKFPCDASISGACRVLSLFSWHTRSFNSFTAPTKLAPLSGDLWISRMNSIIHHYPIPKQLRCELPAWINTQTQRYCLDFSRLLMVWILPAYLTPVWSKA